MFRVSKYATNLSENGALHPVGEDGAEKAVKGKTDDNARGRADVIRFFDPLAPVLLDSEGPQGDNDHQGMLRNTIARPDGPGRSGGVDRPSRSRPARLSQLMLVAIGACFCTGVGLSGQTSDSPGDANKSWTSTTELQGDRPFPTRTTESYTPSSDGSVDKESVQRLGPDGHFEPYQDVEKQTVKVDATTVRTTTRTFGRDADGAKTLVQVTEEEKHTLPGGDSSVVRVTSNSDGNGRLQVFQREVEETKKISKDVEETKATVMQPSVDGGLAPTMKVQEVRKRGPNDSLESKKTVLLPDGAGNWQVDEIRQATTTTDGKNLSIEERVSRPDSEGKLAEVSRTVTKESESSPGEKHDTVETYSVDVPGAAPDGELHLVERATTVQRTSPTGAQTTQQQVEKRNPGDPGSGLRVTTLSSDSVSPGPSGAQATRTVQVRDTDGAFGVVSVDTAKSDDIHAIQVQIGPSGTPK